MADCLYHGYSGGPGKCPECEREDRDGKPRGSERADLDAKISMEDLTERTANEITGKRTRRKRTHG